MGVKHGILVLAETFLFILFVSTSNYLSRLLHVLACEMEPILVFNFSKHKFSQYNIHFGLVLF